MDGAGGGVDGAAPASALAAFSIFSDGAVCRAQREEERAWTRVNRPPGR